MQHAQGLWLHITALDKLILATTQDNLLTRVQSYDDNSLPVGLPTVSTRLKSLIPSELLNARLKSWASKQCAPGRQMSNVLASRDNVLAMDVAFTCRVTLRDCESHIHAADPSGSYIECIQWIYNINYLHWVSNV